MAEDSVGFGDYTRPLFMGRATDRKDRPFYIWTRNMGQCPT